MGERMRKKDKIAELTAQGWSARRVANILGTTERYVWAVRKKLREQGEMRKNQ